MLLPLDRSKRSENAIDAAVQRAGETAATLDIMQAVPWSASLLATAPEAYVLPASLDEELERAAFDYLNEVEQRLPKDFKVERHVIRGDPALSILDHAERTHADLIVMSSRGRSALSQLVAGSVAQRVIASSVAPVLVFRPTP